MAHRGRLNVMAHVLCKPYEQILAEFKDPVSSRNFREDMAWTGDVKYHAGALRAIKDGRAMNLEVSMPPNPSHLEAIDPVVEGMARAAGTKTDHGGAPKFDPARSVPILIHGDAAFPGQGIVAETLNLGRLNGWDTGGTIHIIANNQLGFTAGVRESYSTSYASGLARGFKIPIVHVNADDPEACVEAARLAVAYRAKFQRDFLIDLIGYRRWGHNEGDEPAFTQPLMYQKIAAHPTVREIWAKTLVDRGIVQPRSPTALTEADSRQLQAVLDKLQPEKDLVEPQPEAPPPGAASKAQTAVPLERLRELECVAARDAGRLRRFTRSSNGRARSARRCWRSSTSGRSTGRRPRSSRSRRSSPTASASAMTGEDVERGTFSHRHAVLHDVKTGGVHVPLQSLPQARAASRFTTARCRRTRSSASSTATTCRRRRASSSGRRSTATSSTARRRSSTSSSSSARVKWGQQPSLVLLLPHAHEGQGPDHASARPERFLQLAADINMRIANCTTAAQYFHLLRRQAAAAHRSAAAHRPVAEEPAAPSAGRVAAAEFAEGRFRLVIDDVERSGRAADVRRVLVCSGKVYVDLVGSERRAAARDVAIVRSSSSIRCRCASCAWSSTGYRQADEVVWVQEEPENMGAWDFIRPHLTEVAGGRPVRRIARPRSASPAEGSAARHARTSRR